MKQIFTVVLILLAATAYSQEALRITPAMLSKMDTSKPVQFTDDALFYDDGSLFADWAKKRFTAMGFTDEERSLLYAWMHYSHFAPLLKGNYRERAGQPLLKYYRAYAIGKTGAIWIPKDKNRHMPPGMQPPMEEGMLVSAPNKSWNRELTVAGTTPPQALIAQTDPSPAAGSSAASGSGTTPGGVQYSTAPASIFGPDLLGCMAIYPSNGASLMYVVSVYGASLGDKAAVADEAYKVSGLADRNYRYEWFSGVNASTLEQRYKRSMAVRIVGKYTIK